MLDVKDLGPAAAPLGALIGVLICYVLNWLGIP